MMKKLTLAFISFLSLGLNAKSQVKIDFEVNFTEPQAHYVEMKMKIAGIKKDYVDVKMPVWAPGSYLIREFSKNVEGFAATAANKSLKTQKINKNTWRVFTKQADLVEVNYRVYAFEVSVRTSFIDASHAFLSSTGIFMYPDGMINQASTVTVNPYKTWSKVSTGLAPVNGKANTFYASNFDILFDSPIEVGNQDVFEFEAAGVKHEVAMYGGGNYEKERLKVDMAKIVEQATAVFGENPNKNYTFIVHNFNRGGGGLEHLNSTVLGATRNAYNTPEGYKAFLALVAHEYFHLWNVKRMRPIALGPFDYEKENYTTNLWVSEGYTSYYENKLLARAGFIQDQDMVNEISKAISNIENSPGAKVQSASSSSFDAWIIQYRPNENSNNSSISYYAKGEVVGALMDLEIANATNGAKSLDDVMKAMYLQCKTLKRGFTDAEFKTMVEKISGISFTSFWEKYVNGTVAVDYKTYLNFAGITAVNEAKTIGYLGLASAKKGLAVVVTAVTRNSGAWVDGINVGDEIITINGQMIDTTLDKVGALQTLNVGDVLKFAIKRDGQVQEINVNILPFSPVKIKSIFNDSADRKQLAVRQRWIMGK
ncbi:MAG: PDZ domain-containing protein [Sphingobacteriaceae bacterium]|nr:PDZ domain-containing protein [Sphingobacteriaceae bacterium]